jgi:hypothetical protein
MKQPQISSAAFLFQTGMLNKLINWIVVDQINEYN